MSSISPSGSRSANALGLGMAAIVLLASCASTNSGAGGGAGGWMSVASMHTAREAGGSGLGTAAVRLADGTVLIVGGYHSLSGKFTQDARFFLRSAEIYDPSPNKWKNAGSMNQARFAASVVLLPKTGQVLAAGGGPGGDAVITPSAEIFDPKSASWTFTAPMSACRVSASASLLASGDVLLIGGVGCDGKAQSSAEAYRPTTGEWSAVASMREARWGHSATTLADGRILVAGGRSTPVGVQPEKVVASAEIYDPAHDTWTPVPPMHVGRVLHAAALLSSGDVIVAGGHTQDPANLHTATASAELYDPRSNTWTLTGHMNAPREEGGSLMLDDGTFLMAGGGQQASAEIYHPSTGTWSLTQPMRTIHDDAALIKLTSGDVLIAGGFTLGSDSYHNTAVAELFHPPKD